MKGLGLASADALEEEDCEGHVLTQVCPAMSGYKRVCVVCVWCVCVCVCEIGSKNFLISFFL